KLTESIANAIIGANTDDTVLDTLFSFQRVDEGSLATRNSLLFGRYVLIQQEDIFADNTVQRVSPYALNPLALTEMRFDRHSERLYKVYPYRLELCQDATGPYDWTS